MAELIAAAPPAVPDAAEKWEYQTDRVLVLPLIHGRTPDVTYDGMLASAFKGITDNLIHRWMFPAAPKTLAWFMAEMKETVAFGILRKPEMNLCGFAYLSRYPGFGRTGVACLNHGFFRSVWGTEIPVDAGRLTVLWCFREQGLDGLAGVIEPRNRLALAFAKKFGFEECGRLPRYLNGEDATLVYLSRVAFHSKYTDWEA